MSTTPNLSLAGPILALALCWSGASAQSSPSLPSGPFLDPTAETLYQSAQDNWASVNETVLRYTAKIEQRLATGIRAPSRDRTLFRQESAVRAFWDRQEDARVQVLAARRQFLEGAERWIDGEDWLNGLTFEHPFEPGGERLFFGMEDQLQKEFFPEEEEFWLAHPLAPGADTLFRYRSGDTLAISLPDGRRLRTIQLHVIPREADPRRIVGTLWIDPESGGLVRAVYRLSRPLDATRDLPEFRDGTQGVPFEFMPGFAKPWTIDLTLVVMEYTLWDFQVWLPRSMRVEGEGRTGQVAYPFSLDVAYDLEAVVLAGDQNGTGQPPPPPGAFVDRDGVAYEPLPQLRQSGEHRSQLLVPVDRSQLATSLHLPPPIWEHAPRFATREEVSEMADVLQGARNLVHEKVSAAVSWGWGGHDLLRYNRVEGLAVGGRLLADVGSPLGPLTFQASAFLGLADREPKARLSVEHSSMARRMALGAFRELRSTDPRARHLAVGNSLNALLFGRDYGEYFQAAGIDFVWRSPDWRREIFELRAYAELQEGVGNGANLSLAHAFDGDWAFRPNLAADRVDEAGLELHLTPAWGTDPRGLRMGLDVYGQGATWRSRDGGESGTFTRVSALGRGALPLGGGRWQVGLEAGAGTTLGDATSQRSWLLGGPGSLRGYDAGTLSGNSFTRGRGEVQRNFSLWGIGAFGDVAWAGSWEEFDAADLRYGVGVGVSVLDGLLRMDLCRGLTGPEGEFRVELHLDGII